MIELTEQFKKEHLIIDISLTDNSGGLDTETQNKSIVLYKEITRFISKKLEELK